MSAKNKHIKRLIPLVIIALLIGLVFYLRLDTYLSFTTLQTHRMQLLQWTADHYLLVVCCYMAIYILAVALSIPGAVFLTLAGGFLFGPLFGTIYVVISATIGASIIFLIVEYSLGDWLAEKAKGWIIKMQHGFQRDAFQYLLVLRLIPLFPFWVVNIVPALLDVNKRTFIMATFIGIIPGSLVYVLVGNGLSHLFELGKTPKLDIIFAPQILLPLIGLALLSLLPVVYKRFKSQAKPELH